MWGTHTRPRPGCREDRFIPTHVGNTMPAHCRISVTTVHPHACGEHAGTSKLTGGFVGSSPRMWGTPRRTAERLGRLRFIPTHVGNTRRQFEAPRTPPVHPHACGEHVVRGRFDVGEGGSSPRMWGTLFSLSPQAGTFLPSTPEQPDCDTTHQPE